VESLPVEQGAEITLDKVLLVSTEARHPGGQTDVTSAKVTASLTAHDRHAKIIVFKKRSKKTYKKTQGPPELHRAPGQIDLRQ